MDSKDGARQPPRSSDAPAARPIHDDRSLADLFTRLSEDVGTLVRQEVALARAEVSERMSQVGRGAVFVAAGGLVLYAGLLALVFAAIQGLGMAMALWLAAVIVGIVVLIIGYVLLQIGTRSLSSSKSIPERIVESVREDKQLMKDALQRRRQ